MTLELLLIMLRLYLVLRTEKFGLAIFDASVVSNDVALGVSNIPLVINGGQPGYQFKNI